MPTERAQRFGSGTVVIRHSHHIACLAAYLTRATDRGLVMLLSCSDPNSASVAPHGGLKPMFTPDPLAFGVPTGSEPVLIDLSASLTTNGMTARLHKHGQRLPHAWLLDAAGSATDDPAVLFNDPKGTILPTGGLDAGHKGYALALIVETLTGGLAGFGRADPKEGWGATVFVQVWDPPRSAVLRRSCDRPTGSSSRMPRESAAARRRCASALPGERGLALKREQLRERCRAARGHPARARAVGQEARRRAAGAALTRHFEHELVW